MPMETFDLASRNDTARAVFMLTALLGQEMTISDESGQYVSGVLSNVCVWQKPDGFGLRVNLDGEVQARLTLDGPQHSFGGVIAVSVDQSSPEPVRLLGDAVMALRR